MPKTRRQVRSPSGRSQMAGAVSICDVSRVMLRVFDSIARSVVAEDSNLLNSQYISCRRSRISKQSP